MLRGEAQTIGARVMRAGERSWGGGSEPPPLQLGGLGD